MKRRKKRVNLNKKLNKYKNLLNCKKPCKDKKSRKIYVWCGLGALLILGICGALWKLLFSRQEKEPAQTYEKPPLPEIPTYHDRQESKMKRIVKLTGGGLYFLLVLGICIVPLLLIWVRPTQATVENRRQAPLPQIYTAEGFNWNVLPQAGAYFTDHFVFRQEMVSINAGIRSGIFGVSPVEDVIVGDNGWLYYAATLDDYQHKNSISERALFNIAHNIALMQEYTEELGKTFVFTIAPNKNSLYGEHMPRQLQFQVGKDSDAKRLLPWLMREEVHYVDLFALFKEQEETLYYARDSHWTEKGAVMVYNRLLDACGKKHETYEGVDPVQEEDYFGDLGLMLFPVGAKPEKRVQYLSVNTWQYVEGQKAEDQFILTQNEDGEGKLLMYRDSFGNSLLPYMAQSFSQTVFSRQVPYSMSDLVTYEPDILIVEKVERQLPTLGKVPPIMSAPNRETEKVCVLVENTAATADLLKEGSYWKLQGVADSAYMNTDSQIYVEVDDGSGAKLYEAFCVSCPAGDNSSTNDFGYMLYISQVQVTGDTLHIRVMTEQEEAMVVLLQKEFDIAQNKEAEIKTGQEEAEVTLEIPKEETEQDGKEQVSDIEETKEENTKGQTQPDKEAQSVSGTANRQAAQGQAGAQSQKAQGQAGTQSQKAKGQAGTQSQKAQGQTGAQSQKVQGQTGAQSQKVQGQTGAQSQKVQGQAGAQTKQMQGQNGAQEIQTQTQTQSVQEQTQEVQVQLVTPAQEVQGQAEVQAQKVQGQTGTQSQTVQGQTVEQSQEIEAQVQAQAQAEAQMQAELQEQTAVNEQEQQTVTEVNRTYMEDCGSDSGYWVITYSDGHVEYLED